MTPTGNINSGVLKHTKVRLDDMNTAIVFSNRFGAFSDDHRYAPVQEATVPHGLVTISYICYSGVVGSIVGTAKKRIKELQKEFQELFPGLDFTAHYDGNAFQITLPLIHECVEFMNATIGTEIAIANEPIETISEYVGAVIGKGGCGLRRIEAKAPCACQIYHDGAFYVRFPCDIPTQERVECMGFIKQALYGRAKWLEERLWDERSEEATRSVKSFCTDSSESVSTYSGYEPTPSEAFGSPSGSFYASSASENDFEADETDERVVPAIPPVPKLIRSKSI